MGKTNVEKYNRPPIDLSKVVWRFVLWVFRWCNWFVNKYFATLFVGLPPVLLQSHRKISVPTCAEPQAWDIGTENHGSGVWATPHLHATGASANLQTKDCHRCLFPIKAALLFYFSCPQGVGPLLFEASDFGSQSPCTLWKNKNEKWLRLCLEPTTKTSDVKFYY